MLQWISPNWLPESEYCLLPSILCFLPFGTLWSSSFDPVDAQRGHTGHYRSSGIGNHRATTDSPSRALFARFGSTNTIRSNSNHNTRLLPAVFARFRSTPTTPRTSDTRDNHCTPTLPPPVPTNSHPLDTLYPDTEPEEGIRVRREFHVKRVPRSPRDTKNMVCV